MQCGFKKMTNRDFVNALQASYLKYEWCAKLHSSNLKLIACNFTTNLCNIRVLKIVYQHVQDNASCKLKSVIIKKDIEKTPN